MKRRRKLGFLVLVAAGIGTTFWLVLRPRELVYQGKTVGAWIADLGSNDRQRIERAHKTLVALGEPAMPYLAKTIGTKESKFPTSLLELLHDEHEAVREHAVEALGKIDPAAVEKAGVK